LSYKGKEELGIKYQLEAVYIDINPLRGYLELLDHHKNIYHISLGTYVFFNLGPSRQSLRRLDPKIGPGYI
jgi:hypothetical protein